MEKGENLGNKGGERSENQKPETPQVPDESVKPTAEKPAEEDVDLQAFLEHLEDVGAKRKEEVEKVKQQEQEKKALEANAEKVKKEADEKIRELEINSLNQRLEMLKSHSEALREKYADPILLEPQRAEIRKQMQNNDEELYEVRDQLKKITDHQESAPLLDEADNQIEIINRDTKNEPITTSDPKRIFKRDEIKIEGEVLIPTGPEDEAKKSDKIATEVEKPVDEEVKAQQEFDRPQEQEKIAEPEPTEPKKTGEAPDEVIANVERSIDQEDKDALIEKLKQENADLGIKNKALEDNIRKIKKDYADLKTENVNLKDRVQKVEKDYADLKDQISQLKTELANRKSESEIEIAKIAVPIIEKIIDKIFEAKKQKGEQPGKDITMTAETKDKIIQEVLEKTAKAETAEKDTVQPGPDKATIKTSPQKPEAQPPKTGDELLSDHFWKEVAAEKESDEWWKNLPPEEKAVLMKSWQGKKAEFTGDLKAGKKPFSKKDQPEYKPETVKTGKIILPSFNPEKFFKVPTARDFNPNEPFKEMEAGAKAKSQLVHAMYRKDYGRKPIRGEHTRSVEETLDDFQAAETEALLDYFHKLLASAERQGYDVSEPKTTQSIKEAMVTAKRDIEKHLIKNYGRKVYQERRSNWWLRFVNFLNSDIAERKTIGDAMDIVAMNGGNIEDAYVAIQNLVEDPETHERDYERLIKYMNAHERRAMKKSLDFSNYNGRFVSPDSKDYDRHQTYRLLQQVYLEGMATQINLTLADRQEIWVVGEETMSESEAIVNAMLELQKEHLMNIPEDVVAKRRRDIGNKLKAAAIGGLIGGTMIALAFNASNKDAEKINQATTYKQPTSRTPKIENVQKVDQTTPATLSPENLDQDSEPQSAPTKKINLKIGDRDTAVEIDKSSNVKEVGSTAEELKKVHTSASKIQVSGTEMGEEYNKFIPDANRIDDLENFINKFNALDEASRDRMDKYIHKNRSGYGVLGAELGDDQSAVDWATARIEELQENLKIEDIDNTI